MNGTIDPRTRPEFTCVGCDVKRERTPNGPVFTTRHYYTRKSDFQRLLSGLAPEHMCYVSIDDKCPRGFSVRTGMYKKLFAAFKREQRAHTLGAREMESSWAR